MNKNVCPLILEIKGKIENLIVLPILQQKNSTYQKHFIQSNSEYFWCFLIDSIKGFPLLLYRQLPIFDFIFQRKFR